MPPPIKIATPEHPLSFQDPMFWEEQLHSEPSSLPSTLLRITTPFHSAHPHVRTNASQYIYGAIAQPTIALHPPIEAQSVGSFRAAEGFRAALYNAITVACTESAERAVVMITRLLESERVQRQIIEHDWSDTCQRIALARPVVVAAGIGALLRIAEGASRGVLTGDEALNRALLQSSFAHLAAFLEANIATSSAEALRRTCAPLPSPPPRCVACAAPIVHSPILLCGLAWHAECFVCSTCSESMQCASAALSPNGAIVCLSCVATCQGVALCIPAFGLVAIEASGGSSRAPSHRGAVGCRVTAMVADGAAARGGIRCGDLITSVRDVNTPTIAALLLAERACICGTAVRVTIIRCGVTFDVAVIPTAPRVIIARAFGSLHRRARRHAMPR